MNKQKTAAAIHDISGLGKCSLTAAIPVLSAAGISLGVLPTAVLSTQTGGLNEYTYRDLTCDMRGIMHHWNKIGIRFDAIYSGYLGSAEQVDIVCDFVDTFKKDESSVFLCDPAMADNGKLYDTFDMSFVSEIKKLCRKADIIVPNITEAVMLLGNSYKEPPYDKEYIEQTAGELSSMLGVKNIVLTGVSSDDDLLGSAVYNGNSGSISYSMRKKTDGMFHSTGDLFASALLGAILNGHDVASACDIATDFTVSAIEQTVKNDGDSRFGLCFEKCLPDYIKELELM